MRRSGVVEGPHRPSNLVIIPVARAKAICILFLRYRSYVLNRTRIINSERLADRVLTLMLFITKISLYLFRCWSFGRSYISFGLRLRKTLGGEQVEQSLLHISKLHPIPRNL